MTRPLGIPAWSTYFLAIANIFFLGVIWVFAFLPAVGEVANDAQSDPGVIKVLLLIETIVIGILLLLLLVTWYMQNKQGYYLSNLFGLLWLHLFAAVLFIFLTAWAYRWDSEFSGLFIGGVPVVPVDLTLVGPPSASSQLRAFGDWMRILVLTVVFATVFLYHIFMGLFGMDRSSKGYTGSKSKISRKRRGTAL